MLTFTDDKVHQENPCHKIPRPPNAFMLYANENRKRLAQLNPQDSNKDISKRLGMSWHLMDGPEKARYFRMAKEADEEHRRRYPGKHKLLNSVDVFEIIANFYFNLEISVANFWSRRGIVVEVRMPFHGLFGCLHSAIVLVPDFPRVEVEN